MKINIITLGCAILLAVGLSLGVGAGPIVDTDGDGVIDGIDNCAGLRNAEQCDTDQDGYGNGCDGDFDKNQVAGVSDFNTFGAAFGDADLDATCGKTLCKVTFAVDDSEASREVLARLDFDSPWKAPGFVRVDDEEGRGAFYLAREGHDMPRVEMGDFLPPG